MGAKKIKQGKYDILLKRGEFIAVDTETLNNLLPNYRDLKLTELDAQYCILRAYGYSHIQCIRMTKKVSMRAEIAKGINAAVESLFKKRKKDLEKKLFCTLYNRSFFDVSEFLDAEGNLLYKTWDEFPDRLKDAVDGVKILPFKDKRGMRAVELQFADRDKAIILLGQYLANMQGAALSESRVDESALLEVFNGSLGGEISNLCEKQEISGG